MDDYDFNPLDGALFPVGSDTPSAPRADPNGSMRPNSMISITVNEPTMKPIVMIQALPNEISVR